MSRSIRVHVEGALGYVTSRAAEGVVLFRDARDYQTYLALLEEYRRRYGFKVFSYCLLSEELHLCVELPAKTTILGFSGMASFRCWVRWAAHHRPTGSSRATPATPGRVVV